VYIKPQFPVFVSSEEIETYGSVLLIFRNPRTGTELRSLATRCLPGSHSEKIVAVMSSSEEVIGFNYVQTRLPQQDITVELEFPEKGVDQVFKVEPQQKPQAPEESFFSKYVTGDLSVEIYTHCRRYHAVHEPQCRR
jgi:hypothetical protein